MKGLLVAIQFMTRLPTPRIAVSDDDFARSIRWFPAVGLILGLFIAGAARLGAMVDPWVGALAALVVWVATTGALHLDGLGDIADASGAAHKDSAGDGTGDRQRLRAVLADPHVGSFGVVAITLQLIAKLVLAHALIVPGQFVPLLLIPFAARIGPLLWSQILPTLHDGLGARFRDAVRPVDLTLWAFVFVAMAWFVPAMLVAPIILLLWAAWLMQRIGGISGDGHGAGIEIAESALMLAILALGAFG